MLHTVSLSLHLFFFLCSPFWFPLSLHTGFGKGRPSWMDWDCQDSSAQQALGWPQGVGREPLGCTGLLGHHGLGVTDDLLPGTGICRCLAAPAGLSQRLPNRSGPTSSSSGWLRPVPGGLWPGSWGYPRRLDVTQLCLRFYLPPRLAPKRRDGKMGAGLCSGAGAPTASPGILPGPRARAAAPGLGHFARGAGCRLGTSPPALHFTPGLAK